MSPVLVSRSPAGTVSLIHKAARAHRNSLLLNMLPAKFDRGHIGLWPGRVVLPLCPARRSHSLGMRSKAKWKGIRK